MSGTKPMKNTMRKPSPLKFDFTSAISKAASIAKDKKATPAPEGKPSAATIKTKKTTMQPGKPNAAAVKTTKTTKVEGKPSRSKSAFAGIASKAADIASKATPMQMKKSGMGKKC
jgi:ribosomal protein S12